MDAAAKYRQQLLDQARRIFHRTPISNATTDVFLATPRHLFVSRYRETASKVWYDVNEQNLQEHLATLYADRPLTLFGDDDDTVSSTISQPSFVLRMLDLLQLSPGQTVFELGAGSGWNVALIARLVGPTGRVYSSEIIPELAARAADAVTTLGIANVTIVSGDGGDGYPAGGPYDRAVFTAGTYDIPRPFHDQIREGGLLLAVIKNVGGGDNLFVLRKVGDHFESVSSMLCGFVQLTGRYKIDSLEPVILDTLPEWEALRHQEIARRPFWWGGKGGEWFMWQTLGFRSFLAITDPLFRAFKTARAPDGTPEQHYFGMWDTAAGSLVIAKNEELISYGNAAATDRFLQMVHSWVDLGMPSASSFRVEVYASDLSVVPQAKQWLIRRPESQFLWSL